MTYRIKFLIKIGISLLILSLLTLTVSWQEIFSLLQEVDLLYYGVSYAVILCTFTILAAKNYILIQGSSLQHTFVGLVKIDIISRFYGLFLPPAVGPEMVRWYKITKNQSGKVFFMAASLFERVGFLLISLVVGSFFLLLSPSSATIEHLSEKILPLLLILIVLMIIAHFFFFSQTVHKIGCRLLRKILSPFPFKERILILYGNFALPDRSVRMLTAITSLSIVWHACFLFRNYLLFIALSIPLSFLDVAWMCSLVFLLQLLPITLAGMGIREGAYAYLFIQLGLPAEHGVAIGLLFFSQIIITAVLGGLLEFFESGKEIISGSFLRSTSLDKNPSAEKEE